MLLFHICEKYNYKIGIITGKNIQNTFAFYIFTLLKVILRRLF